jgi:hypothetical protein
MFIETKQSQSGSNKLQIILTIGSKQQTIHNVTSVVAMCGTPHRTAPQHIAPQTGINKTSCNHERQM